jgi:DNA-binding MarR family transcriptional regulator
MANATLVASTDKAPKLVKSGKKSDKPKGKEQLAAAAKAAKEVKAEPPKKAVYTLSKLTKDQREYYDSLTKEEQAYWLQNGHLRGIVRKNGLKLDKETVANNAEKLAENLKAKTLTKPQARILAVLNKSRGPQTRKAISELTGIDTSWVGDWIGTAQEEGKLSFIERTKGVPPLVKLKFVKWVDCEQEGRTVACAEITPAGKKALEVYDAEQKEAGKHTSEEDLKETIKRRKAAK